jgi:hypothetical protein
MRNWLTLSIVLLCFANVSDATDTAADLNSTYNAYIKKYLQPYPEKLAIENDFENKLKTHSQFVCSDEAFPNKAEQLKCFDRINQERINKLKWQSSVWAFDHNLKPNFKILEPLKIISSSTPSLCEYVSKGGDMIVSPDPYLVHLERQGDPFPIINYGTFDYDNSGSQSLIVSSYTESHMPGGVTDLFRYQSSYDINKISAEGWDIYHDNDSQNLDPLSQAPEEVTKHIGGGYEHTFGFGTFSYAGKNYFMASLLDMTAKPPQTTKWVFSFLSFDKIQTHCILKGGQNPWDIGEY